MRKILFLAAVLANFVFAKDMFIFDIKADLLDPKTKEVVGEIYEGTPVKFIKQEGDLSLIEVSGEVTDNKNILAYKKAFLMLKNQEAICIATDTGRVCPIPTLYNTSSKLVCFSVKSFR